MTVTPMARDLQSIFKHIQEMKKEQKEIKKEYRDSLAQSLDYTELLEQISKLKERKQQIELRTKESMGRRWEKHDELKDEVESEQEMLNDMAMTTLMDGKTVEVTDEYSNKYEPIFSVRFKKAQ